MKIAQGSKSWVVTSFFTAIVFIVLYLVFNTFTIGSVFLFISVVLFLLTILFLVFFRDPERNIGSGIVVCADGKIREIIRLNDNEIGESTRIS